MSSFDQRRENDLSGLRWVSDFGWIRSRELSRLMFPGKRYANTQTDRILRGWRERGLILERKLPDNAARAIVLSEAGARMLCDEGFDASTGKNIGETIAGQWQAPKAWKHDLLAAGILSFAYEQGHSIFTERLLRKHFPTLLKYPDGIWLIDDKDENAVWLEVESARKTGKAMKELARSLMMISRGQVPDLGNIVVRSACVAYVPTVQDERGYRLDHRTRVTQALKQACQDEPDCCITWLPCRLRGHGIESFEPIPEIIQSDRVSKIFKIIEAR